MKQGEGYGIWNHLMLQQRMYKPLEKELGLINEVRN